MSEKTIGRRGMLKRALTVVGAAALAPTLLCACEGDATLNCSDTADLSVPQMAVRDSQRYVEAAPDPAQKCSTCDFFTAGPVGQCGSCTVVQGPIHPDGTCNLWAAQV